MKLLSNRCTTDYAAPLQNRNLLTRHGKIVGAHQTIVTTANDYRIHHYFTFMLAFIGQ